MNKPTYTEVSRTTFESIDETKYGDIPTKRTEVITKQTWPEGSGIYSGQSYEIGSVFMNGCLINDWSKPWGGK